jgi:CheY-like chemotaxis protein
MGGDITVSSDVGKGTRFTFAIPCDQIEGTDLQQSAVSKRVMALESGQPRCRLLIVDDQADNRTLLVRLLSSISSPLAGFDLREAVNGQDAIAQWEAWHPHLIWMDLRMPVLGGYEAAQEIRKLEIQHSTPSAGNSETTGTKIIALSASSLEEARSVAVSHGCDDFLRKPFREHEIFDMLTTHLGVRFVYAEDAHQSEPEQPQSTEEILTPEALATLPDDVLKNLERAVEALDTEAVSLVIERVREHNVPLAEALLTLANNYRFDLLQDLCTH